MMTIAFVCKQGNSPSIIQVMHHLLEVPVMVLCMVRQCRFAAEGLVAPAALVVSSMSLHVELESRLGGTDQTTHLASVGPVTCVTSVCTV